MLYLPLGITHFCGECVTLWSTGQFPISNFGTWKESSKIAPVVESGYLKHVLTF